MKKLLPYVYQTESAFEKRRPLFCQRHGNKQDEFGFDLQVFARTELYMRFLFEDYFQVKLFGIETSFRRLSNNRGQPQWSFAAGWFYALGKLRPIATQVSDWYVFGT